jgi:hypothetical protein
VTNATHPNRTPSTPPAAPSGDATPEQATAALANDAASRAVSAPAEPRQRWRVTFARDPVAPDQVGRPVLDAWQEAMADSGLPCAGLDAGGGRARIAFAAPLPAGASGDAELVDLWLLERRPLWAVRAALAPRLPAGHRWIGAEDVWLGAPALAGRVVAADWRVELDGTGLDHARIADAAHGLIAARTLPRTRIKGATAKTYDLRPLLASVAIESPRDGRAGPAPATGRIVACIRTRFHPELGPGRPEEVVAALAEELGAPIEIASLRRAGFVLGNDLPSPRRR